MKHFKHYLILLLAALCTTLAAAAQGMTGSNMLHACDLESQAGKTVAVAVRLANSDEVVGLQFNVQLPYDAITEAVRLADLRSTNGHAVSIRSLGSRKYTVVVSTLQNRTIPGSSGDIVIIPMPIPATAQMGARLPITISDVVIANRRGDNIATTDPSTGSGQVQSTGYLTILDTPTPDYAVSDVAVDSPATSYSPEAKINVKWRVTNIGKESASGGWSESVYLVASNGTTCCLGTSRSQATIAAGASISRYDTFTIPKTPGIDGDCQIKVVLTPNAGTTEQTSARENNTGVSAGSVELLAHYTFKVPMTSIAEGHYTNATLTRSGDRSIAETFELTTLGTGLVTVPATVTIRAGQSAASVRIEAVENDIVNPANAETITIYREGEVGGQAIAVEDIGIEDNEMQPLRISFAAFQTSSQPDLLPSTLPNYAVITEGDKVFLVIDVEHPFAEDQELSIACDHPRRVSCPASVVLPAGQKRAVVTVSTINDIAPDMTEDVLFVVKGNHLTKGEGHVQLNDNDMPVLTLSLNSQAVGEGDGPACLIGTLRRNGVTSNEITVRLSDDSEGDIYFPRKSFTLPRGTEELNFDFGVVDNQEVDGERVVNITAAVFVSSCGCTAGDGAGRVTVPITIVDNDGPTLTVRTAKASIYEGDSEGSMITITRNTSTEAPLTISLQAAGANDQQGSQPNAPSSGLVFEQATVTIPAGAKSVTTRVWAPANDVSSDSRTATIYAMATGFNRGATWLRIVDETLPDLLVVSISSDVSGALPGSTVRLSANVANIGNAPCPAGGEVYFKLEDGTEVGHAYLPAMPADPAALVTATADVTLPATYPAADRRTGLPANFMLQATALTPQGMAECLVSNNSSDFLAITPLSPFASIVATVDVTNTRPGETVNIEGDALLRDGLSFPSLDSNATMDENVEIYLVNNGVRNVITAPINPNTGHFSASYTIPESSVGTYHVGACYPGEGKSTSQATFNVYGLRRVGNEYIMLETVVGTTYDRAIAFTNPGTLGLTNIKAELSPNAPSNYDIKFLPLEAIAPGEVLQLRYSITPTETSASQEWDRLPIIITSDEGARYAMTLYCFASAKEACLKSDITKINTTMIKGKTREYVIPIRNVGTGESGPITVSIPNTDWMRLVTPTTMRSLQHDEEDNIVLAFTPNDNMPLNVPYTGTIGINCANGQGLPLTYRIENVSSSTGTLIVDACDENTYYSAEAPHLADAEVVVRHPITGALITQGRTGADGLFTVELPEGYYTLNVTADEHDAFSATISIDPERVTRQTVNLSIQAITVDWTVVETEVEDVYEIKTTMTYKTNVPRPVLKVDWPSKIDADELMRAGAIQINAVVTNLGLITANHVGLTVVTEDDALSYEYLHENDFDLAPQQSVVLPVIIHYNDAAGSNGRGAHKAKGKGKISCTLDAVLDFMFSCGAPKEDAEKLRSNLGDCGSGESNYANNMGVIASMMGASPHIKGHYPYGFNAGDKIELQPYEDKLSCNPAIRTFFKQVTKAAIGAIPVVGTALAADEAIGCINYMMSDEDAGHKDLECVIEKLPHIDEVKPLYDDFKEQLDNGGPHGQRIRKELEHFETQVGDIIRGVPGVIANHFGFIHHPAGDAPSGGGGNEDVTPKKARIQHAPVVVPDGIYDWPELVVPNYKDSEELGSSDQRFIDYLDGLVYIWQHQLIQRARYHNVFGSEAFDNIGAEQFHILIDAANNYAEDKISRQEFLALCPPSVDPLYMEYFVDRIYNTHHFDTDNLSDESFNRIYPEVVDYYNNLITIINRERLKTPAANVKEWYMFLINNAQQGMEEYSEEGVCAKVKIEIGQRLVMTRQAFLGTLTVTNGHKTKPMTDVRLNLQVTNSDGDVVGRHEFQINPTSLKGFNGDLNFEEGWTLDAGATGVAEITFIPTKYAATDEPEDYSFGGTFSYVNPYTGLLLTRELYPVTLTVRPTAELDLTYFMQRDVLGDDPFTDVVEPMEEAEFALLIHNKGRGDATKVHIATEQPKIVENEKGLYVDFEIVSSQVAGGDKTLAFGSTVPADFGTIPAGTTTYAQWMMTCSLLGHFAGYKVESNHVTSYDNPDLSLLDEVTIHELIHSVRVPDAEGNDIIAWLCNDLPDTHHLPDIIYSSDATTLDVAATEYASEECSAERLDNTRAILSVFPQTDGWTYAACADPAAGNARLISVTRLRDGKVIPLQNCWLTAYTIPDDGRAINEYRVHILDDMTYNNALAEKYELVYEPNPTMRLAVQTIEGRHKDQKIEIEPVRTIHVTFNKEVNPETFTIDDIELAHQGTKLDLSGITISHDDYRHFTIDLGSSTIADGYYVLTINTIGIVDTEGFHGKDGRRHDWVAYADGLVTLLAKAEPQQGGYIRYRPAHLVVNSNSRNGAPVAEAEDVIMTAEGQRVDYDTNPTLTAVPNKGYQFAGWYEGDAVVGTEQEYNSYYLDHTSLTARFKERYCNLSVVFDDERGSVNGASDGYYPCNETFDLHAVPKGLNAFLGWYVDGECLSTEADYPLVLDDDIELYAHFRIPGEFAAGDVDEDGDINHDDVLALRSMLLREQRILPTGDVNGDGKVTIADLARLIDALE